jgi:hypothetical protein
MGYGILDDIRSALITLLLLLQWNDGSIWTVKVIKHSLF